MGLKELDFLGDKIHDHWYHISKCRATREFPGIMKIPEVLDVGAESSPPLTTMSTGRSIPYASGI